MKNVAAFSGGKDSTAMVLLMGEQGEDFSCAVCEPAHPGQPRTGAQEGER